MESKKINQLATELTPALSDLTIIGDPTTGISKKITLSQMASLFTGTVEEYPSLASFPLVGVADTIYIALDTNVLYRWNTGTSAYVELSPNIINSLVFSDANGFDGNISLVGSVATLTITTALTQGSVPFIGTSGALTQDNANLFFDDTNNRLGINTNAPTTALDVFGSGIIGRVNGTSTNNAFLGFANAGTNRWSIGNVQSDHRFRIFSEANSAELITILQTGEFGIGIANPTTKFHIDGAASALIANLDANVSVAKTLSFRSDNSNRINLEVSGTESGSNAGANLFIRAYSDAGSLINTPLTITRSTGNLVFNSIDANGWFAGFSNSGTNIGYIGATAQFATTGGTATDIGIRSGNAFAIYTGGGTERLRINSTGLATFLNSVGIGAANSIGILDTYTTTKVGIRSWTNISGITNNYFLQNSQSFNYGILGVVSGNGTATGDIYALGYTPTAGTSMTPVLNWTSNGNVGIGTNPTYLLHAYTTEASNARFYLQGTTNFVTNQLGNTSGSFYMAIDSSTGGGFSTESYARLLYSTDAYPLITYVNGSERMRISSSGNIGIGESNPTSISTFRTLEIRGATGGGIKIGKTSTSQFNIQQDGTDAYFNNTANGSIFFYTNDTERARILANGNIQAEKLFIPARQSYKSFSTYYGVSVIGGFFVTSYGVDLAALFPEVAVAGNIVAVYGKYAIYRGAQAESGQFGMSRNSGNTWTSGSFSNQTATGAYSLSSVIGSTNTITFNFNTGVYFVCEITCIIS
jgi:hypothetical protein